MLNGRMSIAHVTEAFAGGVTRYMTLVLPALVARGHAVALYCCDGRGEPTFADAIETMRKAGVRINLLPMHRALHPLSDIRALIRLRREFKSGRYDMVHTHGTKAGLLGRLAARRVGIPAVHTPHCYAFLRAGTPAQRLLTRMAERALAGNTSGLIAVCESERQAALRHGLVDPSRCAVISNGLPMANGGPPDRVQLRQELGLAESSFVITMAARLVDYKGIALFLDVADLCRDMDAAPRPRVNPMSFWKRCEAAARSWLPPCPEFRTCWSMARRQSSLLVIPPGSPMQSMNLPAMKPCEAV
jgi:glycosyltransferase involved in cell wall biosynthesis